MLKNNTTGTSSKNLRKRKRNKRLRGSDTGFRDNKSNKIRIGDTVEIITKGKSNSTLGQITSVKEHRLSIQDIKGTEITRAPHNLIVKEEEDKETHNDDSVDSTDSEGFTTFEKEWGFTEEVEGREFI